MTTDAPNYQYIEDDPHVSEDRGTMALVVRKDAAGTLVNADGDYAPLQVDADGNLRTTGTFSGEVEIKNDTGNPIPVTTTDDLATETTLVVVSNRFSPSVGSPVTVAAAGTTVVYTPAAGNRIRLKWIGLSSPDTNLLSNLVDVILAGTTIYRWDMGSPGAFAHGTVREGAVDGTLAVSCSLAETVRVNFDIEEF